MADKKSNYGRRWGGAPWWGWASIVAGTVAATATLVVYAVSPPANGPATATSAGPVTTISVTRPDDRPLRVYFAGDSITYGLYATEQRLGYRQLMSDEFEAAGPTEVIVADKAFAGAATVANIANVPDSVDLAIIELGTNDVGGRTPIDEFRKTYAGLLDTVRSTSPNAELVCVGTWGSDGGGFGSDPYNEVIEKECTDRDGLFVTMYDLFPREELRGPAGRKVFGGTSDDFHPNDAGYRAIADKLMGRIDIN